MSENDDRQTLKELTPTGLAPLIFISHDSRDAEIAEAFSKLLSSVSAGVLKSFRSSDKTGSQGIEYGTDWYPRIMRKLALASDVVCLLTARSAERPWILYEAGVAKGRSDSVPVHGIALGIPMSKASAGPFAQFQNCADDETSLIALVKQLVSRIPEAAPDSDVIQMQVAAFKARVNKLIEETDYSSGTAIESRSSDTDTIAKLFEEVKVMFQDLPSRLEAHIEERVAKPRSQNRKEENKIIDGHIPYEALEILRSIASGRIKVSTIPNELEKAAWDQFSFLQLSDEASDSTVTTISGNDSSNDTVGRGNTLLQEIKKATRTERPILYVYLNKCTRVSYEKGVLKLFFEAKDTPAAEMLGKPKFTHYFSNIIKKNFALEGVEVQIVRIA